MLDSDVVELCAACLAHAAVVGGEDDFALAATALCRDIADTHGREQAALLEAAVRVATASVDASEIDRVGFVVALRRLARLRESVFPRAGDRLLTMRATLGADS